MNMIKKRVLFCTEASYLSTGYAVYAHEILKRLHATGKYELFEFASYAMPGDPRNQLPWVVIPVLPSNETEKTIYESDQLNQFGKYKFEQACLQSKPDVIMDVRDIWYMQHELESPFRRIFKLIWMPTVDSDPQPAEWVDCFSQTDALLTYSEYGYNHLKERGGDRLNLKGIASPGADFDIFKPNDAKKQLGINKFVIGTVMRNQKRKLIPNLIEAFKQFQKDQFWPNLILYLHTTWPDMGWNLPDLIKNSGIGDKIWFTYVCRKCQAIFPQPFSGAVSICKRCGDYCATLPNTQSTISREALANVMNCFDIYVQYHLGEGFAMPIVEAAACELPVFATDYSAPSSILRTLKGYPIKVDHYEIEAETQLRRGYPSDQHFYEQVKNYYYLPYHLQEKKKKESRQLAMKHFNYDKAAQVWMDCIDELPKADWSIPPDIRNPVQQVPQLDNCKLVEWAIVNILGRPELVGSYFHLRRVRDLNMGATHSNYGGFVHNDMSALNQYRPDRPYSQMDMLNELANMRQRINEWETRRLNEIQKR